MRRAFRMAMEADLNTPEALQVLNYSSDEIRTASLMGRDVAAAQLWLRRAAGIFGLRLDAGDPEPRVQAGWEKHLKQLQAK
jgi:cysteinyl-tRNA synthetase